MRYFRFLFQQTAFQVGSKIISSGTSFLLTILIARSFGVEGYGDFAKITAYVSLFYLLVDFGLNTMYLQQENHQKHFWSLFSVRMALACILLLVANGIALALPFSNAIGFSPFIKLGIFLFSFTFFGQAMLASTGVLFQKQGKYQYLFLSTTIGSLITLGIGIAALLFHASLPLFLLAYVLGMAAQGVASLLFSKYVGKPKTMDVIFVKKLLQESLPVTLMLVFNLIYFRIDVIILSLFKPSADVAYYDISYRVFDFLIALPLFLSNVLYPRLIQTQKNLRKMNKNEWAHVLTFGLFGLVVAGVFWIIGPLIFYLIKPQLAPAVFSLRILLIGLPIFFITNILQWILLARRQQTFLAYAYAAFTVVNIGLNLLFIPHYSYIGSAIITDVSEGLVLLALLFKIV